MCCLGWDHVPKPTSSCIPPKLLNKAYGCVTWDAELGDADVPTD